MLPTRPGLNPEMLLAEDLVALGGCDAGADHLLQYDESGGGMNANSIRIISEKGLLRRLLASGLIHADGKLTDKGVALCRDLQSHSAAQGKSSARIDGGLQARPQAEIPRRLRAQLPQGSGGDGPAREPGGPYGNASKIITYPEAPTGELPSTSPRRRAHPTHTVEDSLIAYLAEQSSEAEQIKMLRTSILFPAKGKPPKSILITSVEPGDGKSFVAANLAISISNNINTQVLLMDCDLRKPTLHSVFGLKSQPGLAEYLAEGRRLPLLLQQTVASRLTVLTAGNRPRNPAELLSSPRMAALVRETARRYPNRIVILDSPPSTLTAEAAVLGRLVDGILMVVKHGKTRLKDIQQAVANLGKEKILGCVINGYAHSWREYYGYRKYAGYTGPLEAETVSAQPVKSRPGKKVAGSGLRPGDTG